MPIIKCPSCGEEYDPIYSLRSHKCKEMEIEEKERQIIALQEEKERLLKEKNLQQKEQQMIAPQKRSGNLEEGKKVIETAHKEKMSKEMLEEERIRECPTCGHQFKPKLSLLSKVGIILIGAYFLFFFGFIFWKENLGTIILTVVIWLPLAFYFLIVLWKKRNICPKCGSKRTIDTSSQGIVEGLEKRLNRELTPSRKKLECVKCRHRFTPTLPFSAIIIWPIGVIFGLYVIFSGLSGKFPLPLTILFLILLFGAFNYEKKRRNHCPNCGHKDTVDVS